MKTYTVTENTATNVVSLVNTTDRTVITLGVQGPAGVAAYETGTALPSGTRTALTYYERTGQANPELYIFLPGANAWHQTFVDPTAT